MVHIDYVYITLVVRRVQLVLLVVPADACVEGLVRVRDTVLLLSLRGFEPLESLIVANCEDEILLNNEQYLNYTVGVDVFLRKSQCEFEILNFAPSLICLENVDRSLRVACIDLEVLAQLGIEAHEPDVSLRCSIGPDVARFDRWELVHFHEIDEPRVH